MPGTETSLSSHSTTIWTTLLRVQSPIEAKNFSFHPSTHNDSTPRIGNTRRSYTWRSPQSSAQGNEREQLEEQAVLQQHEQIYRCLTKVLPYRATDALNKGIPTQKPGIPKHYRTEMLAGTVPHGKHEEGAYENLSHFDHDGEGDEASLRLLSSATLDTLVRSRTSFTSARSPTEVIASQRKGILAVT